MGSSIAWRLSQQGLAVTVLERSIPGAEASSAAAGMLAPQKEATGPGPLFELGLMSRQMYPEFVLELEESAGFQVDLMPSGMLDVAWDEASENRLSQKVAWQTSLGVSAQLLTGLQAREIESELSPKLRSAAYFTEEKQVDNRKLVRALNLAVSRAGAKFRTGYVRAILADGQNVKGVDLDGEKLQSRYVVIAAGSWSGLISGAELSPQKIKPVRGQMVEFQTRVPPFRSLLSCPEGYLVPRADGRVIAGSTSEFVGFDKRVTVEGLGRILTMAQELCPARGIIPAPWLKYDRAPRPSHACRNRRTRRCSPQSPDHRHAGPSSLRGRKVASEKEERGFEIRPFGP